MKILIISLCLLFQLLSVSGQKSNLTIQLDSILFRDMVDTLEKVVPVKIYHAGRWTDSLYLSLDAGDEFFEDAFGRSLRREGFSFIITEGNKLILSKGYQIKTGFMDEYRDFLKRSQVRTDTIRYMKMPLADEETGIGDESRIFRLGKPSAARDGEKVALSGNIFNITEGQALQGAIVYIEKLKAGAMTNEAGYYSISIPAGQYQVEYRMVGMRTARRNVIIYSDGTLDVGLAESANQLGEIVVSANRGNIVRNVSMGIEKIDVKMLRQIPMGMGEADIVKSSLMLPGVQTVGEASGGFNVRGGSSDQNLVLLNNAPVINSSHFFGFFSAFNSDMISDVTLYKSGMPARFGGRLSSVMDISLLEGNSEKLKVSGGISPVTGRLMVEGPIVKGRSSFIAGGRATYSDWILDMLRDEKLKKSSAGFYDFQALLTTTVNAKNSLSLSGYLSSDMFSYYRENAFNYGNLAATLRWKHTFSRELSADFQTIISNYDYQLDYNRDSTSFSSNYYALNQKIARADFLYNPSGRHRMDFGLDATWYSLLPGERVPFGDFSVVVPLTLEKERALEPALYFSDEFEVSSSLLVSGGIRAIFFTSFGPGTDFIYSDGLSRSPATISDSIMYRKGEVREFYPEIELRLTSRLILSPRASLKVGVQRVYQHVHMLSNTTSMSPTDVWILSDRYARPQRGDQVSAGLYRNSPRRAVETSVEAYYKWLDNILDYKSGAQLLMNRYPETDVISGKGKAYGVELMVRKQSGALTGWISYTWSRVLLKVDGQYDEEKVNGGEYFPASYDKPHDLKIVANLRASRRFSLTSGFNYNTGRPITFPVAFYDFNNRTQVSYSERNEYRIPDYMRLDLSATLNGNLKARKLNHSSLSFTVYNVLGRKNPYSVFFKNEGGAVKGYQMTIFAQPVFMLTYNFRILGNASGDF